MRFVLFTDKKINECVAAINERLKMPGTATRPALAGRVDKKGHFALALSGTVLGRFTRQTWLEAQMERDGTTTVIRGDVASGASPAQQRVILIGVLVVSLFILAQGEVLLALLMVLAGGVLYIPLRGDYENSERLLIEVERTLKASPKPPKRAPAKPAPARPAAAKPPVKPAPKPVSRAQK